MIQDYINQLQAVLDAANADAAAQATAITGLKSQLASAQNQANVDQIVAQGIQAIIDQLTALLPPGLLKAQS